MTGDGSNARKLTFIDTTRRENDINGQEMAMKFIVRHVARLLHLQGVLTSATRCKCKCMTRPSCTGADAGRDM
jgi:hypothetical protein